MSRQAKSDKPDEYSSFETALKKVLSVPRSKMKSKLDAKKRKRSKRASVSHVSTATN